MCTLSTVFRRTLFGFGGVLAMINTANAVAIHYGTFTSPDIMYLGNGTPPDPQGILESTSQVPGQDPATLLKLRKHQF